MNCIPALVAGVKNIYMTTPLLGKKANPAVIYAAKKCGVKEIYKIGGAQAIADLAFGTKKIKKVKFFTTFLQWRKAAVPRPGCIIIRSPRRWGVE